MDARRYQEIRRTFMMLEAVALASVIVVASPPRRNYEPDDFKPLRDRKRRDYPTISELSGRRRFIKSSKR